MTICLRAQCLPQVGGGRYKNKGAEEAHQLLSCPALTSIFSAHCVLGSLPPPIL